MSNPALLTGLGAALAISLSALGSATASCTSAAYGVASSEGCVKSLVPIIVSGVLGIYGLIVAVILSGRITDTAETEVTAADGYRHLATGLAVGLSCLASGTGISNYMQFLRYTPPNASNIIHDDSQSKQATKHQPEGEPLLPDATVQNGYGNVAPMTVKAMMMLCFLEALGLYGLIVALFLIGK